MKKFFKRLAIVFFTLILLIVAAGFCITTFFGKEVISLIVNELNKNLNIEIRVGEIDFTVFKRFPDASIEFSDVIAFSSKNINKSQFAHNADTLLIAKKLFLQFNVWDIVEKRYKIKAIHLENAFVQVLFDSVAQNNFQILKDTVSSAESDTATVSLNLKKVSIKNSVFVFDDRSSDVLSRNTIKNISFSGNFRDESYVLSSKASLVAENLTVASKRYFNANSLDYKIEIQVDKKHFKISTAEVALKKIQLSVSGDMDFTKQKKFNLLFSTSSFQIQSMQEYLPDELRRTIAPYHFTGNLLVNGAFKGVIGQYTMPSLSVQFSLANASLLYNKKAIRLETEGVFKARDLSRSNSFTITLDTISAQHDYCTYSGNAVLSDFEKLKLQATGNVSIDLEQLSKLFGFDNKVELRGSVETPIQFIGQLSQFDTITPELLQSTVFKNKLRLHNVFVNTKEGFEVKNINGGCTIVDNNSLEIDSLQLQYKNIIAKLSGSVNNLIPYVLFDNESLHANLDVHTSCIDLDDLIAKDSSRTNPDTVSSKAAAGDGLGIPKNIVAVIALSADCFVNNKLSLKDLKTNLTITEKQIIAESCSFNTMGGRASCDLLFQQRNEGGYSLKTTANLTNIQTDKIFTSFNNFDQDFLTEKNIKGSITAKITFLTDLTSQFDVNTKTLYAECSATIQNGQLIHFAPMKKLSQFVELSELENVTFKTLKNDFLIKNEVLYIPKMDIISNAFEMSILGEHSFSNAFDYHLKVLLNDFLTKKRKKQKPEDDFGEIEDDGLGRIRLPLRIHGTTEKFDVSADTKTIKEDIKESLKHEKNEIGRIFKEEFNLGKKDTITKPKQTKPKEPDKFQIQWDD